MRKMNPSWYLNNLLLLHNLYNYQDISMNEELVDKIILLNWL